MLSIRSLYHPDRQSTLHFTWKCLNGWRKESRARPPGDQHLGSSPRQCVEPCVAAGERVSGETNYGNAAPTSLQPRPGPTRFLFVYPSSNPAWKDTILGLLKMCRLLWRMLWKRSQFKTSRRATTRGRTAGNGVLMLKDVILKNIKCV